MLATPGPALRVYRVADVARLARAERELGSALFGLKEEDRDARRFRIHPVSGYLFFADDTALWKGLGAFPTDRREIEKQARAFLQKANRNARACRAAGAAALPALFPDDLRPSWIGVVSPSKGPSDHALCRFAPYLYATPYRAARVEGAYVELRLGADGKVIGLSSRWRPLAGEIGSSAEEEAVAAIMAPSHNSIEPAAQPASATIAPPAALIAGAQHHAHEAGHAQQETQPEYVFWMEDEDAPQTILAPHLLALQGHHGGRQPGSQHSLVLEILRRTRGDSVELLADVAGGSGSFDYRWAAWTPARILDDEGGALRDLGSSPQASIEGIEACIMLEVRDRVTRVVSQVERMLYPLTEQAS